MRSNLDIVKWVIRLSDKGAFWVFMCVLCGYWVSQKQRESTQH